MDIPSLLPRVVIYRAAPVIVTPLSDDSRINPGACMINFGEADGVRVLYDPTARQVVRIAGENVELRSPDDLKTCP